MTDITIWVNDGGTVVCDRYYENYHSTIVIKHNEQLFSGWQRILKCQLLMNIGGCIIKWIHVFLTKITITT